MLKDSKRERQEWGHLYNVASLRMGKLTGVGGGGVGGGVHIFGRQKCKSAVALMEFEAHLEIKRHVGYQSVGEGKPVRRERN